MTSSFTHSLGCDISKDKIDIALLNNGTNKIEVVKICLNDIKGYKQIEKLCKGKLVQIAMEATGNYHIKFIDYLSNCGIKYSVINPLSVKRYSQMKLQRVKTDKVDSKMIAMYCKEQKPSLFNDLNALQKKLKSLNTTLKNFIKQRTQLKNLLHSQKLITPVSLDSIKEIKSMLNYINKRIANLEKKIALKVKKEYPEIYKRVTSIKGVGERTASAIISYMGDLRTFSTAKKVTSFIGITPAIEQSGKSKNKSSGITKQGNTTIRTLLYMAALSASQSNLACKNLYQRLIQKGKQKKTALIAVSNKLIKQIFAVVKNKTDFINDYNLV